LNCRSGGGGHFSAHIYEKYTGCGGKEEERKTVKTKPERGFGFQVWGCVR